MKKAIFLSMLMLIGIALTGCSSCHSDNAKQAVEKVVKPLVLIPEQCISTDREAIYLRTPQEHTLHWMQTGITMTAFLTDAAIQDATVMEITNGFQTQWPVGNGIFTKVTLITTNTMATDSLVMNDSFYLDNDPLDEKQIRLTFNDALTKALEANCPKPQTRQCVLRAPVGPIRVYDAYYIFGDGHNDTPMVFVNARTGEVTTKNPAFVGTGYGGLPLNQ